MLFMQCEYLRYVLEEQTRRAYLFNQSSYTGTKEPKS